MADSLSLQVSLKGDSKGLVGSIDISKSALRDLANASRGTADEMVRNSTAARRGLASISEQLSDMRRQLIQTAGAGGVGALAKAALEQVDAFNQLSARLKLVTGDTQSAAAAQASLFSIAQKNGQAVGATTQLYIRLADAVKQLNGSQEQTLDIVSAVSAALKVSGGSAAEQASSLTQLAQALGSGRLQGDELRSIMENAPRLAQAIAQGMNVTVGQLKKLGEEGRLTSDAVGNALIKAKAKLENEAASMPLTISQALEKFKNASQKSIGENQTWQTAARTTAAAIETMANNFDAVSTAIGKLVSFGAAGAALVGLEKAMLAVAAASTGAATGVTVFQAAVTRLAALGTFGKAGLFGTILFGTYSITEWLTETSGVRDKINDTLEPVFRLMSAVSGNQAAAIAMREEHVASMQTLIAQRKSRGLNTSEMESGLAEAQAALARIKKAAMPSVPGSAPAAGTDAKNEAKGLVMSYEAASQDIKTATNLKKAYDEKVRQLTDAAAIERSKLAGRPDELAKFNALDREKRAKLAMDLRNEMEALVDKRPLANRAAEIENRMRELSEGTKFQLADLERTFKLDNVSYAEYFARKEEITLAATQKQRTLIDAQIALARSRPGSEAEVIKFGGEKSRLDAEDRETRQKTADERVEFERQINQRIGKVELERLGASGDRVSAFWQQWQNEFGRDMNQAILSGNERWQAALAGSLNSGLLKSRFEELATSAGASFANLEERLKSVSLNERLGLLDPDEARAAGAAIRSGALPALDEIINRLREVAVLSGNEQLLRQAADLAAKQAELKAQTIEAQRDLAASATAGAQDYVRSIGDMSTRARTAVTSSFKGMEDALVQFVRTGKLDFASLADSIISDLIRIRVQETVTKPLAKAFDGASAGAGSWLAGLFGLGGNAQGGFGANWDSLAGWVSHTGSGPGDVMPTRMMPASTWNGAPRFHSGIGPNERAAIITKDESVLTPGQMRQLAPVGAGAGPGSISVEIKNTGTPQQVTSAAPRFDGQRMVIDIFLKDLNENGSMTQGIERRFGLRKAS